jgi:hypothetical protein
MSLNSRAILADRRPGNVHLLTRIAQKPAPVVPAARIPYHWEMMIDLEQTASHPTPSVTTAADSKRFSGYRY